MNYITDFKDWRRGDTIIFYDEVDCSNEPMALRFFCRFIGEGYKTVEIATKKNGKDVCFFQEDFKKLYNIDAYVRDKTLKYLF